MDAGENTPASMRGERKKSACFVYYMQFNNSALLYREAQALQSLGFDVDIVDLRSARSEKIATTFAGLNIYGIQVRSHPEKNARLYFTRLLLFHLKASLFISWMALRKRYRLIQITAPPDFMVYTALVPKILGAKIILDIHDISPELFMEKLHVQEGHRSIRILKRMEAASSRFADHVITVTDQWRDKLVSRSVPSEKCSVLLNVPDDTLFSADAQIRASNSTFNLYYHGSLEEHFGVDTLLRAMPAIREHIPQVRLHIYGGGRLQESFAARVKESALTECVKIYPKIPFYRLPELLRQADLGIVPTRSTNFADDTISMKSLEYMSLGIPVVISRTRAHSHYFDEAMVRFFTPDDDGDLARCVIRLFKNRRERTALAENARSYLQKNGWPYFKKVYLQLVEELIQDGPPH